MKSKEKWIWFLKFSLDYPSLFSFLSIHFYYIKNFSISPILTYTIWISLIPSFLPLNKQFRIRRKCLFTYNETHIHSYVCCKIKTKFLSNGGFTRAIERSRRNIIGAKDFLHNNQTIIHTYACPRPTNLLFNLKTTFSSFDFFFSLPFFFGRPPLIFQMDSFVEEEGGRDKKTFWKKNHSHYRLSVFK